jgi:ferredoxin
MRRVRFGARERLEMAAAWASPAALVVGGATALLRPAWALPLVALAVAMAVALFFVYERIPGPRRLVFGAVAAAVAAAAVALAGGGAAALAAAVGSGVFLTVVLTFDYEGSTPVEGGSHFEEGRWQIALDLERCAGVFSCWEVCPEACFEKPPAEVPKAARKVALAHRDRCIRCGACVVQCPQDALAFEDASGRRIPPDTIRRFKLNLLGRRAVDAGPPAADL